jgi:hypothetical protein
MAQRTPANQTEISHRLKYFLEYAGDIGFKAHRQTAADSRLLLVKSASGLERELICVMCMLHEEGQKHTWTRRKLPAHNLLKKRMIRDKMAMHTGKVTVKTEPIQSSLRVETTGELQC